MHYAGSYNTTNALYIWKKWFQPPCDKYDRWRHCVNKFELQPPNNSNMYVRIIQTYSWSERILIFFAEFDNFQSSAKKPVGGVASWLEQTMIVQHQGI